MDNVYGLEGIEDILGEGPETDILSQEVESLTICILGDHSTEVRPALLGRLLWCRPTLNSRRTWSGPWTDCTDTVQLDWPAEAPPDIQWTIREAEVSGAQRDGGCIAGAPGTLDQGGDQLLGRNALQHSASFRTGEHGPEMRKSTRPCLTRSRIAPQVLQGADAEAAKAWCQLGALKDKLAVQVQLVRSGNGEYKIGDAYTSTPAPFL